MLAAGCVVARTRGIMIHGNVVIVVSLVHANSWLVLGLRSVAPASSVNANLIGYTNSAQPAWPDLAWPPSASILRRWSGVNYHLQLCHFSAARRDRPLWECLCVLPLLTIRGTGADSPVNRLIYPSNLCQRTSAHSLSGHTPSTFWTENRIHIEVSRSHLVQENLPERAERRRQPTNSQTCRETSLELCDSLGQQQMCQLYRQSPADRSSPSASERLACNFSVMDEWIVESARLCRRS